MKYWTYVEPTSPVDMSPKYVTLSEDEIIEQYFTYWSSSMKRVGKSEMISHQACIEDWVIIHWAWSDSDV